jgi:CBS domain-containing protein
MTVAQILSRKGRAVITVVPSETLQGVVNLLAQNRIGAVVVVDGKGGLAGIVSERDVVRAVSEHGGGGMGKTVADIMTKKVRTCSPEDTEAELMGLMTEHRIRHLPVLEGGKLTGMISIGDVVKLRIESIEREAEEMKSYIASAG